MYIWLMLSNQADTGFLMSFLVQWLSWVDTTLWGPNEKDLCITRTILSASVKRGIRSWRIHVSLLNRFQDSIQTLASISRGCSLSGGIWLLQKV